MKFHPSYAYSDGDILLRASDNVFFRVHSIILKLASGFFRQMLEIPRAASESPNDAIPLAEESSVFSFLLDLVYPASPSVNSEVDEAARLPKVSSLSFAWAVTNAADKYDMPRALAGVRASIMSADVANISPLGLYALASRWKWTEEARLASTATLSSSLSRRENLPILRTLDSESICKLLELHMARKEAILKFFDLEHRDHKYFIVYQWECGCSTEEDGTKTEAFIKQWDSMRSFVIVSLEACPLGQELRDPAFWSKKDIKLWSFTCHNCGKLIINKPYFIKRVGEVFQNAKLPNSIA